MRCVPKKVNEEVEDLIIASFDVTDYKINAWDCFYLYIKDNSYQVKLKNPRVDVSIDNDPYYQLLLPITKTDIDTFRQIRYDEKLSSKEIDELYSKIAFERRIEDAIKRIKTRI